MSANNRVIAGVEITDDLITALLADQAPQYSSLEVGRYYTLIERHLTVRLGDTHAIRFQRTPVDDSRYDHTVTWLRANSRAWTTPHQITEFVGEPGHGFPYRWEVVPWIEGATALRSPLTPAATAVLGVALREIHQPAPSNAPRSPESSVALAELMPRFEKSLAGVDGLTGTRGERVDATAALQIWNAAMAAPVDTPLCWIHGDLDPRFVISDNGHFAGFIEWHSYGPGDPAIDLGCAAILGGPQHIDVFLAAYNPNLSDATVARSRGVLTERALAYAQAEDPQLADLGWMRLRELHVTVAP